MNNGILLLKTLLLSTSRWNIYRHTDDRKKRKRVISGTVAAVIVYAMLMVYSVYLCIGYGQAGMINAVPVTCSLTVSMLAFIFTFFKTNGYLFNFREYDTLMSLPFEARTVAVCKFIYMYIKSLPWYLSISVAMMAGYGYYAHPSPAVYPVWLILSLILPVIPMLISAFIGFLIARVSAGFRKTNIVQTVLSVIFIIFCFSSRFFIEDLIRDDKVGQTLKAAARITETAARYYMPAGWFADAVTKLSVPGILLLGGVSVALFAAVFLIVGRSYRNINSALKSHAAARRYRDRGQKARSVVNAIAFKEFKRMTGSSTYMVNSAVGEILALLLGIVTLIAGFDRIVSAVTQEAPFDHNMLQPAIPFIVHFFIGMMPTTVCSPSLEGRNYWIIQSLPIEKRTVYQGKMLFNMYLSVPFALISTLCMCIAAKAPLTNTVLYLLLSFCLCAFSTAWGCVCGVRHMRLDWENEVEVIKQGSAVMIYMLPNIFVIMALTALVVFLGTRADSRMITAVFTAISAALSALCYRKVMKLAK